MRMILNLRPARQFATLATRSAEVGRDQHAEHAEITQLHQSLPGEGLSRQAVVPHRAELGETCRRVLEG